MAAPPDALVSVAAAISDGTTVNWTAAESQAQNEDDRRLLDQLRILQGFMQFQTLPLPAASGQTLHSLLHPSGQSSPDDTGIGGGVPWGPLRVLEKVGRGTYGDVYRAWDTRLDREVALKVLRHRESNAASETSTIVEEARLLARVRHPNVLAVYGAEKIDGRVGFWAQFIHGSTLEDEIRERGRFETEEIVSIGVDLCRALTAVHAAGFLHRDVKAQNVMRDTDRNLVLTDFGTVRELQEDGDEAADMAGTPAYLAPEILNGDRASVQSDLYSLGVLLYRLATGSLPAVGRTLEELRHLHLTGGCGRLASLRPDLAADLVAIIDRALATSPELRFEGAEAMASALAALTRPVGDGIGRRPDSVRGWWLGAGVVVLLALGLATWWTVTLNRAAVPFNARDAVLVADVENFTGDQALDDSLRYAFEDELSNSPFLTVVPRERIHDALRLMKQPPETRLDQTIAREVAIRDGGIRVIVAGKAEKRQNAYVLTARILAPADGAVVGSAQQSAASVDQFLPATRQLAERVRELLGESAGSIARNPPSLQKATTRSLVALQLYSRAHALMAQEPMNNEVARDLLTKAIAEDPDFAIAHVLLSHALENLGRPSSEFVAPADRARELLADGMTEREHYLVLGRYHGARHEWERAAAAYRTLLELHPDDYWAAHKLRAVLQRGGRTPTLELLERIAQLRPRSFHAQADAAFASYRAGLDDRALRYAAVAAGAPGWPAHYQRAGVEIIPAVIAWLGDDIQRVEELARQISLSLPNRAVELRPSVTHVVAGLYLTLGQFRNARALYDTLDQDARFGSVASLLAEYGDPDRLRLELESQLRAVGMARWPKNVSLLVEAGMVREAREALEYVDAKRPGGVAYIELQRGMLAEREGRFDAALDHLNKGVELQPLISDQLSQHHARTYEHLARVWSRKGDRAVAVKILEEATRDRRRLWAPDNPMMAGFRWIRLRSQLARLYREMGRAADAQRIEADLLKLLARADSDHPVVRQLGPPGS